MPAGNHRGFSKAGTRFFYFQDVSLNFPENEKSPPGRIALRRRGIMSLKRPAAGGESCCRACLKKVFRKQFIAVNCD